MRNATFSISATLLIAALTAGCVPSLHPLHTAEDVVFEERLLGTWSAGTSDASGSWEFKRRGAEEKAYHLTYREKAKYGVYLAHLVRLEGHFFLDLYPGKPLPEKGYHAQPMIPVHWFLRVRLEDANLRLDGMDHSEMKKLLAKDPAALAHEPVDDGFLITAPTPALQKFVLAHAGEDDKIFVTGKVLEKR